VHELFDTILFEKCQVFLVRFTVVRAKEIVIFTRLIDLALPASLVALILAAFPDLAERRASPVPAALGAPELHHQPQGIVALLVIFERSSEG